MVHLDVHEAILFRLLTRFFGEDRVIPHMSVLAACGGELPQHPSLITSKPDLEMWAKSNRCLFTVVDFNDLPVMVVEIHEGEEHHVVAQEMEHLQFARPLLRQVGVRYLTISPEEIAEITDPNGTLDFFHWLKFRVESEGVSHSS